VIAIVEFSAWQSHQLTSAANGSYFVIMARSLYAFRDLISARFPETCCSGWGSGHIGRQRSMAATSSPASGTGRSAPSPTPAIPDSK
jgi:hypothetical protein